jgi:hypothetical protein
VSVSEEKAQKLLSPALNAIKRNQSLRRHIVNPQNTTKLTLRMGDSPDRKEWRSTVEVQTAPCKAGSLRGEANCFIILEEFGHFFYELAGSDKSDRQIFEALDPSRADFQNPETGADEGMMFIVSTPWSKLTYMYVLEQQIWGATRRRRERNQETPGEPVEVLDVEPPPPGSPGEEMPEDEALPLEVFGEDGDGLVLHIPSYWVNPRLTPKRLRAAYRRDPQMFAQEYGGEYVEGVSTALTTAQIEGTWDDNLQDLGVVRRNEAAYMGFDLGLSHDGTALSVVAVDEDFHCRLIHHEYHHLALPEYRGQTSLDIQAMAERVDTVWNQFGCQGGFADFWDFAGLVALLRSQARTRLVQILVTPQENDRVARHFIETINQRRLTIYVAARDWHLTRNEPEYRFVLSRELLNLQRVTSSGDPPRIKLRAPTGEGCHDDQYSSLSRSLWAAKVGVEARGAGVSAPPTPGQRQRVEAASRAAEMARLRRTTHMGSDRPGRPRGRW